MHASKIILFVYHERNLTYFGIIFHRYVVEMDCNVISFSKNKDRFVRNIPLSRDFVSECFSFSLSISGLNLDSALSNVEFVIRVSSLMIFLELAFATDLTSLFAPSKYQCKYILNIMYKFHFRKWSDRRT